MAKNENNVVSEVIKYFEVEVLPNHIVIHGRNSDNNKIEELLKELKILGLQVECDFSSPCG